MGDLQHARIDSADSRRARPPLSDVERVINVTLAVALAFAIGFALGSTGPRALVPDRTGDGAAWHDDLGLGPGISDDGERD